MLRNLVPEHLVFTFAPHLNLSGEMKYSFYIKFITLTIMAFCFSIISFAQRSTSATATVTAEIVDDAISVVKTSDLNFGKIIKNTSGGTVTVGVNDNATPTNITMASQSEVSTARFTASGTPGTSFWISLSWTETLTNPGGQTMTFYPGSFISIDDSTPGSTTSGTIGQDGTSHIKIGGQLNVGQNQATGVYTNSSFTITVNYN